MVNTMNTTKRYEFGIKIDLLNDMVAKKISNRVSDVREQAVRFNYVDLDSTATDMYNRAYDLYVQGRYKYEPKFTGERYNLLTHAAGVIVITHRFNKVKWEITAALKAGTSVAILKPFSSFELKRRDKIKNRKVLSYSSSIRISKIWQAAFATGVPGPKIAATPALYKKS